MFKRGDLVTCVNSQSYERDLTEGKTYTIDKDLGLGIFATWHYVTVFGDKDRNVICYASRFKLLARSTP